MSGGCLVRMLPENTRGADIVVGDIHGCFDQLESSLSKMNFDPAVDRVISVGDLVDRGPLSSMALEYINKKWFFPIRGKHEAILIEALEGGDEYMGKNLSYLIKVGAAWLFDLDRGERSLWLESLRKLPYVIEVESQRGPYGAVHADVPAGMNWATFKRMISAGDKNTTETAIWGRTRAFHDDLSVVEGIGRIFVGHTIHHEVTRRGNVFFIDAGAFVKE